MKSKIPASGRRAPAVTLTERSFLFLLCFAPFGCVLFTAHRTKADTPTPEGAQRGAHRVRIGVSGGTAALLVGPENGGGFSPGAAIGYAYNLGSVEVGVQLDYRRVAGARERVVLGGLIVRPRLALSTRTELGVSLRIGTCWIGLQDLPDHRPGPHLGLAADLRLWATRAIAMQIGPEVIVAGAPDQHGVSAGFFFGGLALGGVYAP